MNHGQDDAFDALTHRMMIVMGIILVSFLCSLVGVLILRSHDTRRIMDKGDANRILLEKIARALKVEP
jgi:hypothetical protein